MSEHEHEKLDDEEAAKIKIHELGLVMGFHLGPLIELGLPREVFLAAMAAIYDKVVVMDAETKEQHFGSGPSMNVARYIDLSTLWSESRRLLELSDEDEVTWAARLEVVWQTLSEFEQKYIERQLPKLKTTLGAQHVQHIHVRGDSAVMLCGVNKGRRRWAVPELATCVDCLAIHRTLATGPNS